MPRPDGRGMTGRMGSPPPTSTALTVAELPGRGLGVVAARAIRRGEVLISERPLVRLTPALAKPIEHWFDHDPQHARRLLSRLCRSAGPPLKWEWWDAELDAVVNTNSFTLLSNGSVHSYIFYELSRLNHHCDPNAVMVFDGVVELATVRATRDIAPGSEVTLNYGADGSLVERQAHLRKCFGFTCTCEVCASEQSREAAQGARRGATTRHS